MADSDQQPLEQHAPTGYYSGSNRIPTIQQFIDRMDMGKHDRDAAIDADTKQAKRLANNRTDGEISPHQPLKAEKGPRHSVTDPTTGNQVLIGDVSKTMMERVLNPQLSVPNANLGKAAEVKTDASQSNPEYARNQDIVSPPDPVASKSTSDVPIHGEKTNILFHPTPSISYEPMFASLEKRAGILCIVLFLGTVIIGRIFGGSLKGLIPLGGCLASAVWLWTKEVMRSGREMEWSSEKERGETAVANLLPESVEWMNTLLGVVWGLINPELFQGVADTLEDVMQASVPGIIEHVRVAEINQGSNPIRILSLRALPDSHMREMKEAIHNANKQNKDPQEAAADEEGGKYYNLEVSFAYHAAPSGKRTSEKARNMHMQLVFYLGIKGLFGVPLPIFVELQEVVGTVRLRMHMTPEPPFLKTLTFTLMGVPHVQAGCIPMVSKGVNILNLPLISNFVNYAIGAASSMYVAPKSMSLDMRALLQGDDITKDVNALGVLWVRIHRAEGLSKQDRRGSKHGGSDPYITLSFSKYGKPMYCTRVITDDLNPIWEESTALLVTPELIKADENLSVELWDSDRHTADDIVGKVELSMQKMIQHPGKMYPQVSKLAGLHEGSDMPGELHWEVGYFAKPEFREALRTDGKNKSLPDALRDNPELQDEKGQANTATDDAVQHTPPDLLWPSGVCSVVVHQIVNLELDNIKGTSGSRRGREFEPAKPSGETTEEEGGNLPTSYCTILFNDELVYRTRAKAVSSSPIFNAGTERFIRDWRSAIITVTVRDQRNREHDPILGVVPMKLTDILDNSSQVTRWYPLDGGIGFGRIRISLLFRSVETRLPPNLLGWDVGTFEFLSDYVVASQYSHVTKLKMRTGGSVGKIGRKACKNIDGGVEWDLSSLDDKLAARLPLKHRYRAPIVIEFHTATSRKADAFAILWLQHLIDNEPTDVDIPIWRTKNSARLVQNYLTEDNYTSHKVGLEDLSIVGRLKFKCRFKAGIDESHEAFVTDNDSRETFETWEACLAEGVRQRLVEKEVPDRVQSLHDASLTEGRDILKAANDEEKKRWLSHSGADWTGTFGEDPASYTETTGRRRDFAAKSTVDPKSPDDGDSDSSSDSDSDSDLGILDATTAEKPSSSHATSRRRSVDTTHTADTSAGTNITSDGDASTVNTIGRIDSDRLEKRTEKRKHRGLMQWKPVRNLKFAKDEGVLGIKKLRDKITGGLDGRKPGVETETG